MVTTITWTIVILIRQFFGVNLTCISSGSAAPQKGLARLGLNDHYYGAVIDFRNINHVRDSDKEITIQTKIYSSANKSTDIGNSTELEFEFYNSGKENVILLLDSISHLRDGQYFEMTGYGSVSSNCSCHVQNMPLLLSTDNHVFLKRTISLNEGTDKYVGLPEGNYRLLFYVPKYITCEYLAIPYYYDFQIDYSKSSVIQEIKSE